jgi:pyruvate/2-oxoglutarate dehydrogenase complex dihydrolipoamide acyltransferase (E2) component
VRAANRGVVRLTSRFYLGGNVVYLDHGEGLVSAYMHLSRTLVAAGDTVARGQTIGHVGSTGRVTGPHLHWVVRYGTSSVDPLSLLALSAAGPPGAPRAPAAAARRRHRRGARAPRLALPAGHAHPHRHPDPARGDRRVRSPAATRVAVVGAGHVGATFAYALLLSGIAAEIVLVDRDPARAEGERWTSRTRRRSRGRRACGRAVTRSAPAPRSR